MKPSLSESGRTGRKFVRRLQALIRPGRKKPHRLSAHVTGEEEWEVDEPQIRMSRAFAVMLVLHLVAVGGLFAFHMFGKDDREAEGVATRNAHASSPPAAVAPIVPAAAIAPLPAVVPAAPRAEIVDDEPAPVETGLRHRLKDGETRMLIAAKFGITVGELEEANAGSEFKAGDILTIPRHQRVIGALAGNLVPVNPPLALIVATPAGDEDVGHRDFALKEGAENPYAPVAPAELEGMPPEPPATGGRLVKAEPAVTRRSPDGEMEGPGRPVVKVKKATPPPVPAKPKPPTGSRTHVIQKGDTIYNVAKRYGISPNEVMRANEITDPSRVQMGQVLKITVKR